MRLRNTPLAAILATIQPHFFANRHSFTLLV
jgi:hypothetical protein